MKTRNAIVMAAAAVALAVGVGCTTQPVKETQTSFVGSERCGGCHVQQYTTWKNSLHAKMVKPTGVGILKDVVDNWSKDGPTKTNLDGKPAKLEDVVVRRGLALEAALPREEHGDRRPPLSRQAMEPDDEEVGRLRAEERLGHQLRDLPHHRLQAALV